MLRADLDVVRQMSLGAETQPAGGVHFRVWAPRRHHVEVVSLDGGKSQSVLSMTPQEQGYFTGLAPEMRPGMRYGYRLDGSEQIYPDPASRFQPDGPHGPSEIVDPGAYPWRDQAWPGCTLKGQVIYEFHVGTFTDGGIWQSAVERLPRLKQLGVTLLEMMPIADFPGDFGWGYDGVNLFAPTRLYGRPDELRQFVDAAHAEGLGVILDVVYNHFGPDGSYLSQFSDDYLSKSPTDWGEAINFDGPGSAPVRELFLENAAYWIREFHFDGLRLDAVHAIQDSSEEHIVAAIRRRVRQDAGNRQTLIFAENDSNDGRLGRPAEEGGYALDGVWNDDFHHAARVATTGHNEGYLQDFAGTPQEIVSALKWGYLYQGQTSDRRRTPRGTPSLDLPPQRFVLFLENHDQIANSPGGKRLHQLCSAGRFRAMTAVWALAPGTLLLFQGQEYGAETPFLFFACHEKELSELVRRGRQESLKEFRFVSGCDAQLEDYDPCSVESFKRSKLRWDHDGENQTLRLHRDLLRLRREDPTFSRQDSSGLHGAVLAGEAFALRYLSGGALDRLVLVNLGKDLLPAPQSEPLLAPPAGMRWKLLWSSEHPCYGGSGTSGQKNESWHLPAHSTTAWQAEHSR